MRYNKLLIIVILALSITRLFGSNIQIGSFEAEVLAEYGQPKSSMEAGRKKIITYDGLKITLLDGVVTSIKNTPQPTKQRPSPTYNSSKKPKPTTSNQVKKEHAAPLVVGRFTERSISFSTGDTVEIEAPINFEPLKKVDSLVQPASIYASKAFSSKFMLNISTMPLDREHRKLSASDVAKESIVAAGIAYTNYNLIFQRNITVDRRKASYHRTEGIPKYGIKELTRNDVITIKKGSNLIFVSVEGPAKEFDSIESYITQILNSIKLK